MNKNKTVTRCQNCGNSVHGFWKYGENKVCSLNCLRTRIANGSIPKLFVERAYPELSILPQNNKVKWMQVTHEEMKNYV